MRLGAGKRARGRDHSQRREAPQLRYGRHRAGVNSRPIAVSRLVTTFTYLQLTPASPAPSPQPLPRIIRQRCELPGQFGFVPPELLGVVPPD
jgi:hypothetical protein